jgi:hypothetical protein
MKTFQKYLLLLTLLIFSGGVAMANALDTSTCNPGIFCPISGQDYYANDCKAHYTNSTQCPDKTGYTIKTLTCGDGCAYSNSNPSPPSCGTNKVFTDFNKDGVIDTATECLPLTRWVEYNSLYYLWDHLNIKLSDLIYNPSTKRLGLGTSTPTTKLTVIPNASEGTLTLGRVKGKPSITSTSTEYMIIESLGNILGLNYWSTQNVLIAYGGGKVGIGNKSPTEKLDVTGNVKGTKLCIGTDCRDKWPEGLPGASTAVSVTGDDLTVKGDLTVNNNITVNNDSTIKGDQSVDGNLTVGGTIDAAEVDADKFCLAGVCITNWTDLKTLLGVVTGGADNLGNHTATQDIILGANKIRSSTGGQGTFQIAGTGAGEYSGDLRATTVKDMFIFLGGQCVASGMGGCTEYDGEINLKTNGDIYTTGALRVGTDSSFTNGHFNVAANGDVYTFGNYDGDAESISKLKVVEDTIPKYSMGVNTTYQGVTYADDESATAWCPSNMIIVQCYTAPSTNGTYTTSTDFYQATRAYTAYGYNTAGKLAGYCTNEFRAMGSYDVYFQLVCFGTNDNM